MGYSRNHEAIVLRALDVGEADRFCILLTRDAGRMGARAKGVRKTNSRKGGSLLPFQQVQVQVSGDTHPIIIGASDAKGFGIEVHFLCFSRAARGIELLLALTHDGEPMPAIFELTKDFLAACGDKEWDPVPAFSLRLLASLGLLPSEQDEPRFDALSGEASTFVGACAAGANMRALRSLPVDTFELAQFVQAVSKDHVQRKMRAEELA